MKNGMAFLGLSSAAVIAASLALGTMTACGKKSDEEKKKKKDDTPEAVDMSGDNLQSDIAAVFPAGKLSLNFTTYESPCKNVNPSDSQNNGEGDPDGPAYGTLNCAVAKLLADPDLYTNVGQEGFLESIQIFTKGFKLSLKNCTDPAETSVTFPVIGETAQVTCGRNPPALELATNIKAALPNSDMGQASAEQLASMLADAKVALQWGEVGTTKNIVSLMQFPPKGSDEVSEHAAWWYGKNTATGVVTLKSVMWKGSDKNRRFLQGNPTTHEFVFNYRWDGAYSVKAFRAKGYSEGAGKYYLIQAIGSGLDGLNETTPVDFCFESDTKAQTDVANCATIKTELEETTFFESGDLPDAEGDIAVPTL